VDPDRVAERVDGKTRALAVAAVRHVTGFRADLKCLSGIAHGHGALFVVDGIQAAGVVPLDVEADGIDVLAGAGFKWLLGMPGTGYLYVRRGLWDTIRPVLPGMFAAGDELSEIQWMPDARRYETGSLAYSLFHAWTAGLEMVLELGVPAIHERVLALTAHLIDGLAGKGMSIVSPVATPRERSAIVSFTAGSAERNQALTARLAEHHVAISLRGGVCRVSPSFYNTEEEIDRLVRAIV
jgi:selenocysteine lyase/cysteine desulfurase